MRFLSLSLVLALAPFGCGREDDSTVVGASSPSTDSAAANPASTPDVGAGPASGSRFFPTSRVVFGDEGQTTYISVLPSLDAREPDGGGFEFPGWADLWVHAGKVFVADGEAPLITRYAVDASGRLQEEGRLSFQNFGASQAAFWTQLFVSEDKAYWFHTESREVVVWNPLTLETVRTFELPELPDRGAELLAGPSADRSSVVRGDRAYVPFYWADWDSYALSDDSVILVFDTSTDRLIDVMSVPCPELNFATVDEAGTIYFSNWGFSAVPTLLDGKPRACAVRILDGSDTLDPLWSLTFAELTDGREASALRLLGDGKALLTVFHDERAEITADTDRFTLTDSANWRLWLVDLEGRSAAPLDLLGWHAPGLYGAQLQGQTFLFVPSADYASTTTYRFTLDGTAERRWESSGWQTRLFGL